MGHGLICALLFAFSVPALAGKVYRCPDGSYQDKPCGQGERVVASNNPQQGPPADADPVCFERGRAARRLVAQREKGVTADRIIKEIDASGKPYEQRTDEKAFAVRVYQTKGSPAEVATLMEADCVSAKRAEAARAAQAASTPAQAPAAAAEAVPAQVVAKEDQALARACKQLQTDARRNKSLSRKGGSSAEMEDLAEQGRDIAAQLKDLCS